MILTVFVFGTCASNKARLVATLSGQVHPGLVPSSGCETSLAKGYDWANRLRRTR